LHLLEDKVGGRVLSLMGFSTATLLGWFIFLTILLLLIFIFIFLGIGACKSIIPIISSIPRCIILVVVLISIVTKGSSFEAVVNSVIAISAGGAMGQQRGRSKVERRFQLKETMNRVMDLLKKAF
jgi:hypothetical protein